MSNAVRPVAAAKGPDLNPQPEPPNDFTINIATVNGSGSQTSNGVLLRTFFKMGIPVNGKNLFPSNIQGLPTWYHIRLSKDGYLAHRDGYEIAVCMNAARSRTTWRAWPRAAWCYMMTRLPIAARRPDVTYYPLPVSKLVKEVECAFRAARLYRQHGLRRRARAPAGHRPGRDRGGG